MPTTVIDSFKEHGFDFLVPIDADQYGELFDQDFANDFNFGFAKTPPRLDTGRYGDGGSPMFGEYEKDVFELAEEEDMEDGDEGFSMEETPESLQNLKDLFDASYMPDKDFLNMTAGQLFGVTNTQLKFIDPFLLQRAGVPAFLEVFRRAETIENIPDVEQRIRYALVASITRADTILLPKKVRTKENRESLSRYVKKLALGKDIEASCNRILLYKDYLLFYPEALERNEERTRDGEVPFPYVLFPKTSHIRDLHDKAMRDHMAITARKEKEHREKLDSHIREYCKTGEYRQFLVKKADYSVVPADSYASLEAEGEALNHCVLTYADAFSRGDTNIYFLRRASAPDTPFYTAEVCYEEHSKRYVLTQCFGLDNTTEKSDRFRDFILEWARQKRIKIGCTV